MGFMASVVPASSIDLDSYIVKPLGSTGEALTWLLTLLASGESVGLVRYETATVSALKRAALKQANISFETPTYSAEKDENGKRVKLTDPPASERMSAVFKREHDARNLAVYIERLSADESVPETSRELVSVTVL